MAEAAANCTPLALGVVNASNRFRTDTGREPTHLFLGQAELVEFDRLGKVLATHVEAGEPWLSSDRVYMGLKVVEVARPTYLAVAIPVICEEAVVK